MKSFSLLKQNLELKYVAVKIPPLVFFQHVDLMLTEKKNVIVILQNSKGGRVFIRFKICFDLKEETHFQWSVTQSVFIRLHFCSSFITFWF